MLVAAFGLFVLARANSCLDEHCANFVFVVSFVFVSERKRQERESLLNNNNHNNNNNNHSNGNSSNNNTLVDLNFETSSSTTTTTTATNTTSIETTTNATKIEVCADRYGSFRIKKPDNVTQSPRKNTAANDVS